MIEAVFDTNIIIDHLKGVKKATELMEKARTGIVVGYISIYTEAELFAGKDIENDRRKAELTELLGIFNKVDVNENIARIAGEFKRKYSIPLGDAIISATAFLMRSKVFTMDIKDFSKVKEISAERPYNY